MATKYRCYLLDKDRIVALEVIESEGDADAVIEADRILRASRYSIAELWDRERRVSIISNKISAA